MNRSRDTRTDYKKRDKVMEMVEASGQVLVPKKRYARVVDADGDPLTIQDLRRIRRHAKKAAKKK